MAQAWASPSSNCVTPVWVVRYSCRQDCVVLITTSGNSTHLTPQDLQVTPRLPGGRLGCSVGLLQCSASPLSPDCKAGFAGESSLHLLSLSALPRTTLQKPSLLTSLWFSGSLLSPGVWLSDIKINPLRFCSFCCSPLLFPSLIPIHIHSSLLWQISNT